MPNQKYSFDCQLIEQICIEEKPDSVCLDEWHLSFANKQTNNKKDFLVNKKKVEINTWLHTVKGGYNIFFLPFSCKKDIDYCWCWWFSVTFILSQTNSFNVDHIVRIEWETVWAPAVCGWTEIEVYILFICINYSI